MAIRHVSASCDRPFRFLAETHDYVDLETGAVLPHITGMLKAAGWIDDTWFTDASSERGRQVHRLTADYDLGALEDVDGCVSPYRGYLLAHVQMSAIVGPDWQAIEVPLVHRRHAYGGRPDRVGQVYRLASVLEVKSAAPARSHQIQTALQAELVADGFGLPPEAIARYCEYLKPSGRFQLEQHRDARDFREARRIIRKYAA
jgi:hypothetical protein